jgi:F1F0 ATPase subunit 2
MNESLILALAGLAGAALGVMFFGGLWWTIRKALASSRPAIWFFGSLVARLCTALAGFYFVSGGAWPRALACLLGFVTARLVVLRATRPAVAVGS